MNINRHNYEEYFLLYVDNELKQDQRLGVETFIQQNSDLINEMEMLKQVVLGGEQIKFDSKDLLYKKDEGINISNYEEYFLLSVDDELNKKDTEAVEKFVLMHPEFQDEFTLLKKVKLEPEVIEFKDKQFLYRKEEKQRRIMPLVWMRMSAAAVILGLIATMWIFIQNNHVDKSNSDIAATGKKINYPSSKSRVDLAVKPVTKQSTNVLSEDNKDKQAAQAATDKKKPEAIVNQLALNTQEKHINQNKVLQKTITVTHNQPVVAEKSSVATNNLPVIERRIESNDNNGNNTEIERHSTSTDNSNTFAVNNDKKIDNLSHVSNAVYREIDTNEEDRNINIGSGSINKNKVKALFKRAAGFFGKNIDKNDEPALVRVAGFQIKGK